jgi:hypothetical protein
MPVLIVILIFYFLSNPLTLMENIIFWVLFVIFSITFTAHDQPQ